MPHEMQSAMIGAWHCQPYLYDFDQEQDVSDDWFMFIMGGEL